MTARRLEEVLPGASEADEGKALVVQTGSPALLARAFEAIRARHPNWKLTVLLQRGNRGKLPELPGVTYVENQGKGLKTPRNIAIDPSGKF